MTEDAILLQRLTIDIGPDAARVALQAIEQEGYKVKAEKPKPTNKVHYYGDM